MQVRIGCSGWYYQHWEDSFYKGIKKSQWFKHYASKFGTVELNSPFYHFPTKKTAVAWYRQAPKDFIYSVKANRAITHMKKFKSAKRLVNMFYSVVKNLEEKLGCVLFQLPPDVHYNKEKLKQILDQLDADFNNVLEFRHQSWWNADVYDALKKHNVIFCVVSAPLLPEDFIRTAKDVYVRFHGKTWYDYDYSVKELKSYSDSIKKTRAKRAWAYFNNDANAFAPKNALELCRIMK